jgi:glutamyl-tRNA synthetase/nondiscriminating glutamyl-tRNA synthetase
MIRVRFAPSPTGFLHIGAARTCFFNWLYARSQDGTFILRIEDTDVERSSEGMTQGIIDGLEWLGLDWDEGPIFQSQRLPVYQIRAEELVEKGFAYRCYCTPGEIKERTKRAAGEGDFWGYDRYCLDLSEEQRRRFEVEGRPKAVRFRVPEGEIKYTDRIHGDISVDSKNIEDFVLLRGDGLPTYHLSVVVDDMDSGISHVIRGDDHISNTPKQILLYRALGAKPPKFAHLALILGPDKKKLSKRHGGTSVLEFRDQGYLPLAFLNFLAQMSWSPGEERIYKLKELVSKFALNKVSKGSPVFDLNKLDWLNGQLISSMSAEELTPLVRKEMEASNLWQEAFAEEKKPWFDKMINLAKERSRTIRAFPKAAAPFLADEVTYDKAGVEKHLMDERLDLLLPKLMEDFQTLDEFIASEIERVLRHRAGQEGVKPALFIHALRMLVVGEPVSPGIFDVLELAGREKTLERMKRLSDARSLVEKKGENT